MNQLTEQYQTALTMLKQALVAERVVGGMELASIDSGFYKTIKSGLAGVSAEDSTEVLRLFQRLTGNRWQKIQRFALFGPLNEELQTKLAPEEIIFYNQCHENCFCLKNEILKGDSSHV